MRKTNPLASRDSICMDDLKYMEFICISPQVLPEYPRMLHELCLPYGFVPNIASYVTSANSLTLNIKSDQEVFICDRYYADNNPSEHALIPIRDTESHVVAAWRIDNEKPYLKDFIKEIEKVFE
jgi:hypothetical protein